MWNVYIVDATVVQAATRKGRGWKGGIMYHLGYWGVMILSE